MIYTLNKCGELYEHEIYTGRRTSCGVYPLLKDKPATYMYYTNEDIVILNNYDEICACDKHRIYDLNILPNDWNNSIFNHTRGIGIYTSDKYIIYNIHRGDISQFNIAYIDAPLECTGMRHNKWNWYNRITLYGDNIYLYGGGNFLYVYSILYSICKPMNIREIGNYYKYDITIYDDNIIFIHGYSMCICYDIRNEQIIHKFKNYNYRGCESMNDVECIGISTMDGSREYDLRKLSTPYTYYTGYIGKYWKNRIFTHNIRDYDNHMKEYFTFTSDGKDIGISEINIYNKSYTDIVDDDLMRNRKCEYDEREQWTMNNVCVMRFIVLMCVI